MRTLVLSLLVVGGLPVLMPSSASAVNCDQVRRYLSTGRSVDDVAETMVINVDDVKKCQQEGSQTGEKAGPKPGDKPAPAAGTPKRK